MENDEIMERLERGEVLRLDDQEAAYIVIEDGPECVVVRRVRCQHPGDLPADWRSAPAQRYGTLAEALLSLMDWEWIAR